ncbi:UNVERIFIED_CONTAM: hypothetical protein PYX00_001600 [Menopon gallinae]|uniref:Dol-P-Glc:Glc(2)Man(9)GlcNAc(2)-PP-Dol alpha-1,2-glucosyltransferase n=1 Tax=Menopon gallinae TaxID=328185 RepID=A0AAW2IET4_9NEOP
MNMKQEITSHISEKLLLIASFLFLTFTTFTLFEKVNETQPNPYIDEIFHIPQAQLFCKNVWTEWNPKITTLPGLYLISFIFLKPAEIFNNNICSTYSLRFINIIGTVINFLLAYLILSKLHNNNNRTKSLSNIFLNVVSAVNIAILPTLYFFTFLYYTDIWSLTFVLLMYYCHLNSKSWKILAAVSGFAAVMMRQTNIVWVGFMTMDEIWNVLTKSRRTKKTQDKRYSIEVLKALQKNLSFAKKTKSKWMSNILSLTGELLRATFPYLTVCAFFISFVVVNGGVVVGDKNAHTATFHPMQVLYFLDFTAFMALPFFLHHVITKKKLVNFHFAIVLSALAVVLTEVNKLEHPYLLADNRHLAFYAWKRIFGHDIMRRVVIPTYGIAAVILLELLSDCNFMFKVCLAFCISFNLSLQYLFEFRYFIIPFVMCRLHFRQDISVWVEFAYFCVINAFTVYIFMNKPFHWASEPHATQRFIW